MTKTSDLSNSYFSTDKYLKQSAAQKIEDIWSQVSKDTDHTSTFPSAVELMGLFTESMNPTFD